MGKTKQKLVYISQDNYIQKYSKLHNNKFLSDVTIVYPKGDSQPAHKAILSVGTNVLEKHFESSNTYTFDKEIKEEAAKSLIKFLYTGSLEYTNESEVFTFMLLANQLKINQIKELKVPPKIYFNGIIEYVEKDTKRMSELDGLLDAVNIQYKIRLIKKNLEKTFYKKYIKRKNGYKKAHPF
jgi:hypothetical protein